MEKGMTVREYLDGLLYHYTSEKGITGIFQKNKLVLQLTKTNSLNDKSEGKDIFDELDPICKNYWRYHKMSDELYNKVLSLYQDDTTTLLGKCGYIKPEVREIRKKLLDSTYDTFVMSFSKAQDCLPMWNYYTTAGNQGYAIKFDLLALKNAVTELLPSDKVTFPEIIYESKEKKEIITDAVLKGIGSNSILPITDMINEYQYIFKHEAFKYEKEVRMTIKIPTKEIDNCKFIKFRTRNGIIVPYLELELKSNLSEIVYGVTVGPLADETIAEENLQMLLYCNGFKSAARNVSTTDIPIRF